VGGDEVDPMNRALLIIMIPALLVAAGYIVVLRAMGIAPGYPRLAVAVIFFLGTIYWFSRRGGQKANSRRT
jgi:hypothetical protein